MPQTSTPGILAGVAALVIAGAVGVGAVHQATQSSSPRCSVHNALPDAACTSGATVTVALKRLCTRGYSSSVRNVPASEKAAVYREYGITHHTAGQYEVDHLISLELGGSNAQPNLWPEAARPKPGFHEKDGIENTLHARVCSGAMTLQAAQRGIAKNWLAYLTHKP